MLGGEILTGHAHGAGHKVEADGAQAEELLQRPPGQGQFLDMRGMDDLDAAGEATAMDHDGVGKQGHGLLLQINR